MMVALLDENRINLFKFERPVHTAVLVMGKEQVSYAMSILSLIRNSGISAIPYLDVDKKFKNQIEFADKMKVDFSIIIGENERNTNMLTLKDMQTGQQHNMDISETIKFLKTV